MKIPEEAEDIQRRHELVAASIAERFWARAVIAGIRDGQRAHLVAYMMVYVEDDSKDIYYVAVEKTNVTELRIRRQVQNMWMHPDDIAQQYMVAQRLAPGEPTASDIEGLEQVAMLLARSGLQGRELPTAIVAYMRTEDTNERRVEFLWPHLAPGEILLQLFKKWVL